MSSNFDEYQSRLFEYLLRVLRAPVIKTNFLNYFLAFKQNVSSKFKHTDNRCPIETRLADSIENTVSNRIVNSSRSIRSGKTNPRAAGNPHLQFRLYRRAWFPATVTQSLPITLHPDIGQAYRSRTCTITLLWPLL